MFKGVDDLVLGSEVEEAPPTPPPWLFPTEGRVDWTGKGFSFRLDWEPQRLRLLELDLS